MPARRISVERKVVPISYLSFDDENINTHGAENNDSVIGSLDEWGQIGDLVVQKRTRKVINGNLRLQHMAELGFDSVAITEVDCDDEESIAISIALNESQRYSEPDFGKMSDAVSRLIAKGFSMESMGIVQSRMDDLISSMKEEVDSGIEAIKNEPPIIMSDFAPKEDDSPEPQKDRERVYPLGITLNRMQLDEWTKKKREIGINSDTAAFIRIVLGE